MTDKEWANQIDKESNQSLFETLVYCGRDAYYDFIWRTALRELAKRIGDVDFEKLGIGK